MTTTDIAYSAEPPLRDARTELPGAHGRVTTLAELRDALETIARSGQPSPADWPHRAMDFRILAQVLEGLEHPVEDFGALLPGDWAQVAPEMQARIPGNPTVNHKRLVARMTRAIGWLRPDLDPWSALQLLAEMEMPVNADIVGEVRLRAAQDGLRPIDIDTAWIAGQLVHVPERQEAKQRSLYRFLVRLSRRRRVQRAGLLRADLALPATRRQKEDAVVLPEWLHVIRDVSDRRTRNALDRLWRTILHHEMQADTPDDLLALIDAGALRHAAAERIKPIKPGTWRAYIQIARKVLLAHVDDPTRYAKRLGHVDTPRKPSAPRRKKPETERAGFRLAMDAVHTLQPPVPAEADALLTQEVWPRVAASMHELGGARGLSHRTVEAYIEEAKRCLARQATRPVPARLPKTIRTARPPETVTPNRARPSSRVPALPAALCAEVHEMLDLCGYTRNAKRAMLATLGNGYTTGIEAEAVRDDAPLDEIVAYMVWHMSGRARTDAQRMSDVIGMCGHPSIVISWRRCARPGYPRATIRRRASTMKPAAPGPRRPSRGTGPGRMSAAWRRTRARRSPGRSISSTRCMRMKAWGHSCPPSGSDRSRPVPCGAASAISTRAIRCRAASRPRRPHWVSTRTARPVSS